jgi:hypothetical protein
MSNYRAFYFSRRSDEDPTVVMRDAPFAGEAELNRCVEDYPGQREELKDWLQDNPRKGAYFRANNWMILSVGAAGPETPPKKRKPK